MSRQASSLLKNAQEVLPLVHAFHKSHNELTDWLVSAEQTLQTVDSQQNAEKIMDKLEKEVGASVLCVTAGDLTYFSEPFSTTDRVP